MATVYLPPDSSSNCKIFSKRLFLAGTIENGKSEDWQSYLIGFLNRNYTNTDLCLFNPRRYNWDSSWVQSIESPPFYQQVSWEYTNLEKSTHIFFNFLPDTYSPISLLELGLFARDKTKQIIVHCPKGFYRKGNVDFICNQFDLCRVSKIEDLLLYIN